MEWDEMRQRASTSTNSCPLVTEIPVLLLYFITIRSSVKQGTR